MSHLRTKLNEEITLRGLSASTRESYTYAVEELSRSCGQPPDKISDEGMRKYLLSLHGVALKGWTPPLCAGAVDVC